MAFAVQHGLFSILVLVSLFSQEVQVVSAARYTGAEEDVNESVTSRLAWTRLPLWKGLFDAGNRTHLVEHVSQVWKATFEAVTGYTASGKPMPRMLKQRVLVFLLVTIVMLTGTSMLVAAGIRAGMSWGNPRHQKFRGCGFPSCTSSSMSATAVLEARHEMLRAIIDAALQHSQADLEGPNKVLSKLFKAVMERILQLSKQGLLEDEVTDVLDSALESHDKLVCSETSGRRRLLLDLVSAAVLHSGDITSQQAAVITDLNSVIQQQIRDLAVDKVLSEQVLLDLETARETDNLLRVRLKEMTQASDGCEGCLAASTVS